MAKVINFSSINPETLANVWILVARTKRTKDDLHFYVQFNSEGAHAALERMKDENCCFVTLFTAERVAQYLYEELGGFTGNNESLFGKNLAALSKVGIAGKEVVESTFENLISNIVDQLQDDDTPADEAWEWTDVDGGIFNVGDAGEYVEEDEDETGDEEDEEGDSDGEA